MKKLPLTNKDVIRDAAGKWRTPIIGLGILFLLFLGVGGALTTATFKAQNDVRELQDQRAAVERQVAALQQYADLEVKVSSAEKLVQQALGTNPEWSALLADISRVLPNGVWMTELTTGFKPPAPAKPGEKVGEGSGELLLRGWGTDHTRVAEWVEALKTVQGLAGVRYQYTNEDKVSGVPVVRFEVKATVTPGVPYQLGGEGVQ
ncbi:MAG: PilN domain-containing protein [Eubacteriales bacterium]|nr:PilN domain-containing protein [Bacillota bacterium]MBV1728270.1 PilN domain-containing protein [Desulforudis sp.]MDP3050075.1 PilN domain-containing protein [Eubacteriales bacterium]MBU4533818.1 PilN domain-containing protein [Bacillota bacterium]MBU4554960.1 PilN domain-containing protein [Bacillota bacterium]